MSRTRWTLVALAITWHLGGLGTLATLAILGALLTGCTTP